MTAAGVRSPWFPVALATLATLTASCTRPGHDLQPGSYRAALDVPGGELPFGLDVASGQQGFILYFVNGEERVPVTGVQAGAGQLSAVLPGSGSKLVATIAGGELRGELAFATASGTRKALRFEATLGRTWRFFEEPLTDNADVAGRWSVIFTDDEGRTTTGVAELQQKFERVTGTVRMAGSEHRFLTGEVHGDELRLSRFDGTVGDLYHAQVNTRGQLEGECWSLPATHHRFVAVRD